MQDSSLLTESVGLFIAYNSKYTYLSQYSVDVLVSNAGICPFHEFLTMPHSVWEKTRQTNLDGSFYIVQGTVHPIYYKIYLLTPFLKLWPML
jgi:NAD(P)-dependent dehydrogenase (short-subunit alcohol dehydrogenase family)